MAAIAELTAKERAVAIDYAQRDLYFYSRYMMQRRRGIKWLQARHHPIICDALTRVYLGLCQLLIINIPPRYGKTQLIRNFVEWSLGKAPDSEFIYASYGALLAAESTSAIRDTILDPEYQAVFPDVHLATEGMAHWKTTAGGVIHAAGTDGTITGFGAGKKRDGFGGCFPVGTNVWTDRGLLPIDIIVRNRLPVRVWSFDYAGKMVLRPIVGWHENPPNDIVRVRFDDGATVECTPDHRFWTSGRGWVRADSLCKDDRLPRVNSGVESPDDIGVNTDSIRCRADPSAVLPASPVASVFESEVGLSLGQDGSHVSSASALVDDAAATGDGFPSVAAPNLLNDARAHAIPGADGFGRLTDGVVDGKRLTIIEDGLWMALGLAETAMPLAVSDIGRPGVVAQISEAVVRRISIGMADVSTVRARTDECKHDQAMHGPVSDLAPNGQGNPKVAARQSRGLQDFFGDDVRRAYARDGATFASDTAQVANGIEPFISGHRAPTLLEHVRHDDVTFCLTVADYHNFTIESGLVVKNCLIIDDAHKPSEVYSDVSREKVIATFQNTIENRLNWPTTPTIMIGQCLHEVDLPNWARNGGTGQQWESIILPALQPDGTALWPEMHSVETLRRMQAANPHNFAGQYQQQPRPPGGAFFEEKMLLVPSGLLGPDGEPILQPVEMPTVLNYVFAVIDTAIKTGQQHDGTGVVYFGRSRNLGGYPLTVLDWDYQQIQGASLEKWLPTVFERLEQLARECHAVQGSHGTWIEDKASGTILLQQAANKGWPAREIDSKLTSMGKDERGMAASHHISPGYVKVARPAYVKTLPFKGVVKNHFMSQVLGFRLGAKSNSADDLYDGLCYGTCIALGGPAGM